MTRKPKGAKYRNLNRHGAVIYYDRVVGGRRISFSTRATDWDDAAAVRDLYESKRRIGTGIAPPREVPRFSDFVKRYLAAAAEQLAPSTLDDRKALLRPEGGMVAHFGKRRLDEIDRAAIMEWWTLEMEGKGRARSTMNNHLNAVSSVLAFAVDMGEIDANPVDIFRGVLRRRRRTKQGRADAERLDRRNPIEKLDRLGAFVEASAAIGGDHHAATMIMLDGGLRIGEVEALTWDGIDAGTGPTDPSRALLVSASRARGRYDGATKSGRARRVGLSQRLRSLLLERRMLHGRPDASALILEGFSRKLYRRHFDCACSAAGVAGHTPKDLRATYASHLLSFGVARAFVALELGHEDETTTGKHYARWIDRARYREPVALLPGEIPADLIARVVAESHNESHNGTREGFAG